MKKGQRYAITMLNSDTNGLINYIFYFKRFFLFFCEIYFRILFLHATLTEINRDRVSLFCDETHIIIY